MSLEIESRLLATLIFLGDPKDIKIQDAMLQLTEDLFKNHESRLLFLFIEKQFHEKEPFDAFRISSTCPEEIFKYFQEIREMAWSANTLQVDIKFLIDSFKATLIKSKLDIMIKSFNKEGLPSAACNIATDGCLEISKLGVINENHVFTNEMCAENYLSGNKVNNRIIPSGIETLDKVNGGGFKENCLITIAGRSGMGKTGFGVHLAHNIASNHHSKHVLFFSLEMSADEIYEKRLATILGRQPEDTDKESRDLAVAKTFEVPFTVITKPIASIDYIETTAKITSIRTPISVIVVDYIGLVQNTSKLESHVLKQADIALRLAALAAELNCIVIALTQVNRDYSNREDKVPITSDAADSSGTERSSSYWLGIYRPEVDDETDRKNDFIVKCRKNRFGNTWSATFAFNNATFGEVDQVVTFMPIKKMKGYANYTKGK